MNREKLIDRLMQVAIWACLGVALLMTLLMVTSYRAAAQWSTDPANPLQICDDTGLPVRMQAMPDGNGGWYAFWIDRRTDGVNGEVFGQHVDADGYAQWTPNGKLLISMPDSNIRELAAVVLDDGNVLINYIFGPTAFNFSLHAMVFDPVGDPVWAQPTVLDEAGTTMLGFDQVTAIPTAGGAYVGWYDNYFGGSNLVNVSRIDNDGSLPWGTGGNTIDLAYYGPFELHDDDANGMMVQWRTGNGTGAALYAMRVGMNGANAWPLNVQVSANSPGLNYGFHTVGTGLGAQITAWRDVPGNIVMARLDASGTLTFPASPMPVCMFASYHDLPKLTMSDGALFAAWADNRPPAANGDVYLQKFDTDGAPLWTVDGIPGIQISTYYTTPGLVASDSGAVIAMTDGNVDGYVAIRVRADGTAAWPSLGTFCTPAFKPFYAERIEMPDGDGGVVSFWRSGDQNVGSLYAGRILRTGVATGTVGLGETASTTTIHALPNPAHDRIAFHLPTSESPLYVEVIDMHGATTHPAVNGNTIAIDGLAAGAYTARIRTSGKILTARFVKQ
ncbi:MAG: T9SS type A sorting domain-containing protein [Flavobacteriales bacterium]|nr:T9SS type A sorting domain-containing protein [Flavobacteriales bacterium]